MTPGPKFSTKRNQKPKPKEPSQLQKANQWRFSIQGRMEGCFAQLIAINHELDYPLPDTVFLQAKIHFLSRLEIKYQLKRSNPNG